MADDGRTKVVPACNLPEDVTGEPGRTSRPTPTLIVYDGDEIGALHPLTRRDTVIGRTTDCDLILPEGKVSRRHALVRMLDAERYELVDLGSTNGTSKNGTTIDRAELSDGDKIDVGGCLLRFSLLDAQDLAFQARICEMIHVDDLTGLLTRRSVLRGLQKELLRAERYGREFSILMMDLDHFKNVNDTHGHLVGSACLAEVGQILRDSLRSIDSCGRYGGEEFLAFLPEADREAGLQAAGRIRREIERHPFHYESTSYRVTISIGVALFPADGRSVQALIQSADEALYRAKRTGRNRCEVYVPEECTIG
ncbi:MAG: GGDEF domain-containing protein [Acidobacteriota bacterium]